MMYRFIWFPFLFMLLSCEPNQEEVSLRLPVHEESLIVECYLEPGENYKALVTKTVDYLDSIETEKVDSLEISLFVDGEKKDLLNAPLADTLYNKVYNYWLPERVVYEEGKEYQITVSYGDKRKAIGKTRFLPKARVKDLYFKFNKEVDSLAAMFIEIEDNPAEKNYYRIVLRGPGTFEGYTYEGLWDDADASAGTLTAFSDYSFWEGETIVVNVYHLEEQYYQFLKSVAQARESNYNPFMQPASIRSSLDGDGAMGIFTAVTLTSDTIRVKK